MGFDVTHPQHPQHQMDLCFFGEKMHVFFWKNFILEETEILNLNSSD